MRKMIGTLLLTTSIAVPALAQESAPAPARKPLEARAEVNVRGGTERSILMNEFWVPITQTDNSVLYGDIRLMGDDQDNREFNAGVGYRHIVRDVPVLGDGVAGVHGWFDRRHTEIGSRFNQVTAGAEWSGEIIDLKLNAYLPINEDKKHTRANPAAGGFGFVGNQIVVSTDQVVQEEAMKGLDFELGFNVNGIIENFTDSTRVYAGAYHFSGDRAEDVTGWRTRIASDITEDFQIGARFQKDDVRGSQGFLEATIRFPFGNKKSYKAHGLYARLDESPERDIDIVSAEAVIDPGSNQLLINNATAAPQKVIHVNNAGANGNGTNEAPYNNLADAEAAASPYDIIYLHRGNGTAANMNAGIVLNKTGQMLIGSGTDFIYDGARFTTSNGQGISSTVLIPRAGMPTISNTAGAGVTVAANDIYLAGFTVDGAAGDGILVDANNISAQNITIRDVATINNGRMGLYLHGYNNGSVSAMVERVLTGGNDQHGIAIYDDTANTFDVDLGGGTRGSSGNNILFGNGLEDLAVEYDGRTLAAMNNWWGQVSGPDRDAPNIGVRPQIYYGAPLNDGLIGHWTFDNEWVDGTTAYDRSGNGYNGTLQNFASTQPVDGPGRQVLVLDGVNDFIQLPNISNIRSVHFVTNVVGVQPGWHYLIDARGGLANGYFSTNGAGTSWMNMYSNGASVPYSWNNLVKDAWATTYLEATNNFTDNVNLMSRNSANETLAGQLSDVRFYNRALTAGEIAELHRMDTSSVVNFSGFLTSAP